MNLKNKLWQILEGLRFYFQASTIYNIHSPLLSSILESIYLSDDLQQPTSQKQYRNTLRKSQVIIQEEVGAGSMSSDQNTIAKAIKYSSSSYRKSSFIAKIAQAVQAKNILELGTNLGMTTAVLSYYNPTAEVHTVEGNAQLLLKAKAFFNQSQLNNIHTHCHYFHDFLNSDFDTLRPDFILIDGDHSYQSTLDYYKIIREKSPNQVCIIFDDIRWSRGMFKAWKEISTKSNATLIVDFYNMGMLLYSSKTNDQINYKIINQRLKPFNLGLFVK